MTSSMSSKRNQALKSKVVIGFLVVFSAFLVAIYISYQSFNELIRAVDIIASPDPELAQIDQVLASITRTENALQEITIAKTDDEKLQAYYTHIDDIRNDVASLKQNNTHNASTVDSILNLIDAKLVSFQSFRNIRNKRDEFDFYNKALREVEAGTTNLSKIKAAEPPYFLEDTTKRRGILRLTERFGDLFSKQKPDNNPTTSELPTESVKKILRQVRNEQAALQRSLDQQELNYLENNAEVMGNIHRLVDQLKQGQQQEYKARSAMARLSMEDALIRIGIILFIVLLSTVIIVYLILADITKSDFYRRNLVIAKSNAEKLARVKEEFLANMSHEIRTPLTAILGFAEQLQFTPLDKQQQEYLGALDSSSQHLLGLVNDILDFSKIEAGELKFEQLPFDLFQNIREVCHSLSLPARKKGLAVRAEGLGEEHRPIIGDVFRLKQILYNLVSNAIKFTPQGEVVVTAQLLPHKNGQLKAVIEVRDTGIGIAPDQLSNVFQAFSQSDASTTRQYGGTGLGLSICKRLVEAQGGKIEVESVLHEGSIFRVILPYHPATEAMPEPSILSLPGSEAVARYQGQALVIDDHPLNGMLLELALKKRGLAPVYAESGREGLARLKEQDFDIIFCDLHMPEMDGKQVVQSIRQLPCVQEGCIPIIAFTANVLPQEKEVFMQMGVDDFLLKPFTHHDLERLLKKYCTPTAPEQPHDDTAASPVEVATADYSFARVKQFTGDSDALLIDYLENFITTATDSLTQIRQALQEGKSGPISFHAHKMVSHTEMLQMEALTGILKELERLPEATEVTPEIEEQAQEVVALTEQALQALRTDIAQMEQTVG